MAFTVAVELSYLKEEEQYELHAVMDLDQYTPSLSQANRFKSDRMNTNVAHLYSQYISSVLRIIKKLPKAQIKT